MSGSWRLAAVAAVAVLAVSTARADEPYKGRMFDGHLHYSYQAWDVFDTEAALKFLNDAEVLGALASSTPDEGTRRLVDADHPRVKIVPLFRPYTPEAGVGSWFKRDEQLASAEAAMIAGKPGAWGRCISMRR